MVTDVIKPIDFGRLSRDIDSLTALAGYRTLRVLSVGTHVETLPELSETHKYRNEHRDEAWHWLELLERIWKIYYQRQFDTISDDEGVSENVFGQAFQHRDVTADIEAIKKSGHYTRLLWAAFSEHLSSSMQLEGVSLIQEVCYLRRLFDAILEENMSSLCGARADYLFTIWVAHLLSELPQGQEDQIGNLLEELMQAEKLIKKSKNTINIEGELKTSMTSFIQCAKKELFEKDSNQIDWKRRFLPFINLLSAHTQEGQEWYSELHQQRVVLTHTYSRVSADNEELKSEKTLLAAKANPKECFRSALNNQKKRFKKNEAIWVFLGVIGLIAGIVFGVFCFCQLGHERKVLKEREKALGKTSPENSKAWRTHRHLWRLFQFDAPAPKTVQPWVMPKPA